MYFLFQQAFLFVLFLVVFKTPCFWKLIWSVPETMWLYHPAGTPEISDCFQNIRKFWLLDQIQHMSEMDQFLTELYQFLSWSDHFVRILFNILLKCHSYRNIFSSWILQTKITERANVENRDVTNETLPFSRTDGGNEIQGRSKKHLISVLWIHWRISSRKWW